MTQTRTSAEPQSRMPSTPEPQWHYCTLYGYDEDPVRFFAIRGSTPRIHTSLSKIMLFAASLLLAVARSSVPACSTPRNVYIDAGVNWCNSLLIFKSVPEARARLAEPWHIFGFEANKRIAPFANLCHRALSAGQPLPTPPIPPAGSTRDLARYAARYNCSKVQLGLRPASEHDRKVYKRQLLVPCMQRALARNLASIHADPALSDNASLLQHRLKETFLLYHCCRFAKSPKN